MCRILFGFLLLLASTQDALAEDRKIRDPWSGFSVGSWVIIAESKTIGDATETKRTKHTIDGSKQLVIEEGSKAGVFDGAKSIHMHIPGFDPVEDKKSRLVDTSKKDLTVQGKKYNCEVRKYEMVRDSFKATVLYWHCKDLKIPYREIGLQAASFALDPDVLRLEVEYAGKKGTEKGTFTVTNLSEVKLVGNVKLKCIREEGEMEGTEGETKFKGKGFTLLSNEVPGREVEEVTEAESDGKKFKRKKTVESFEVIKEK